MTNTELLNELNAFRAIEGKDAFADWRKARHMPMLEAYRAEAVRASFEVEGDEPDALMIDAATGEMVRESEIADTSFVDNMYPETFAPAVEEVAPVAEEVKVEKPAAYKVLARLAPSKSGVEKPVNFVHQFLDANPTLKRKEAIAALVEHDVNFSTARTQYQKWFSARKG